MNDPAELELPPLPDTSHLITENDDPVDNIPSEKNQRLLVGSLYASWAGAPPMEIDGQVLDAADAPRPFLATANVGLFDRPTNDPLVTDVLVSNDVELGPLDWGPGGTRSYFVWAQGKPPELVIELVSNKKGDELARKRLRYGRMRVAYYVVFDAARRLGDPMLRAFKLGGDRLDPILVPDGAMVDIEPLALKLGLWEGTFENQTGVWLRFFDREGRLLLTGDEKAEAERQTAEAERQKAEAERQKAERLAEKLRSMGVDPSEL